MPAAEFTTGTEAMLFVAAATTAQPRDTTGTAVTPSTIGTAGIAITGIIGTTMGIAVKTKGQREIDPTGVALLPVCMRGSQAFLRKRLRTATGHDVGLCGAYRKKPT